MSRNKVQRLQHLVRRFRSHLLLGPSHELARVLPVEAHAIVHVVLVPPPSTPATIPCSAAIY
jgi:hypothetical protein